jgi:hypothetical protein
MQQKMIDVSDAGDDALGDVGGTGPDYCFTGCAETS